MGYRIEHVSGAELPWQVKHDTYFTHCGANRPYKDTFIVGACRSKEDADILLAGLTAKQPQPTGPTVRCRIAVATGADWWCAYGQGSTASPTSDEDALRDLEDEFGKLNREDCVAWVEASVPLPQRVETAVVQGTVVTGESQGDLDASAS